MHPAGSTVHNHVSINGLVQSFRTQSFRTQSFRTHILDAGKHSANTLP